MARKFDDTAAAVHDIVNAPEVTEKENPTATDSGSEVVESASIAPEVDIEEKSGAYASFVSRRISRSMKDASPDEQEVLKDAFGLMFKGLMAFRAGMVLSTVMVVGVGILPFLPRILNGMKSKKNKEQEGETLNVCG